MRAHNMWGRLLVAGSLLSAHAVLAQQLPAEERAPQPLTPPELVEFVEADYPSQAQQQGLSGSVLLAITVGLEGEVVDVEIIEGLERSLDRAAAVAARQFRFRPALRGSTPIASRIQYRYVFELSEQEPPQSPPEEPPVAEPDGAQAEPDDDAVEDNVEDDSEGLGAETTIDAPAREVTRHTVSRDVFTRIAGTRGDALRAVEILPGVGRPPFGAGQLLIRGSAPQDSQVFVEGVPLPQLYHFGGFAGVINPRLLERIDFYPGGFSARYGRKMGGIVEIDLRDPRTDRLHGIAELSGLELSAMMEIPLSDKAAVAVGVRRSIFDLFLPFALPEEIGIIAAPVFYDYQAFLTYKPSDRDRLRIRFYGSSDNYSLLFDEALGDDPNIRGSSTLTARFNHLQLGWQHRFDDRTKLSLDLLGALWQNEVGLGNLFQFDQQTWQTTQRLELQHRASDRVRLIVGVDSHVSPYTLEYSGPFLGQLEGASERVELGEVDINTRYSELSVRPAVYFESDIWLHPRWQVVLGGRVDYDRELDRFSFDPRLVTSVRAAEGLRLKAGAGVFSQPPELHQSAMELNGNPELEMQRSAHFGAGFDWELQDGVRVGLEGFYKHLWNLVSATVGGLPPGYENVGTGTIYGGELSAQVEPRGRKWFGYLSYTLSRSERRNRPGDPTRLFDFDQTHIFAISGNIELAWGIEVGATFRLVSGNPTTPTRGAVLNLDDVSYTPITGTVNTERNPLFHRLDIRIQKAWSIRRWKLLFFLDIQNLYNRRNQEGLLYNYDYTQAVPLRGLPFLTSTGIRAEI